MDVTPNHGPISGRTEIKMNVTGLEQPGICGLVVRMGTYDYIPTVSGPDTLTINNIPVDYPGLDSVQVSYNQQQFSSENVVHATSGKQIFKYYQDPLITYHRPVMGPSVGGTKIKINGLGFQLFPMTKTEKEQNQAARASSATRQSHTGDDTVENELWMRYMG